MRRPKRYRLLYAKMLAFDLSQKDIGQMLGLTQASVSSRFTGRQPWSMQEAWTLMRRLRIPANELHRYFPENGIGSMEEVAEA